MASRVELFRRRNNLSWSHHAEVASARVNPADLLWRERPCEIPLQPVRPLRSWPQRYSHQFQRKHRATDPTPIAMRPTPTDTTDRMRTGLIPTDGMRPSMATGQGGLMRPPLGTGQ